MRRVFLSFSEDASMPPMSVQRLGEAITHLATRTPKPWRTTRRLRRVVARAPSCALRQSSAASSWLPELPEEELALLLASDPEPWPTSWFPESSPWRTTRRLRRVVARAPLLRTEAVLSRILLAAVAARRGVRSFACIGS